jgi:hypothetical protein
MMQPKVLTPRAMVQGGVGGFHNIRVKTAVVVVRRRTNARGAANVEAAGSGRAVATR